MPGPPQLERGGGGGGGSDSSDGSDDSSGDSSPVDRIRRGVRRGVRRLDPRQSGGGSDDSDSSSDSSSNGGGLHGGRVDENDSTSGAGGTPGGDSSSGDDSGSSGRGSSDSGLHGGRVDEDDSTSGAGGASDGAPSSSPGQSDDSTVVREEGAPSVDNSIVQGRIQELRGRLQKRRPDLNDGDYRIVVQDSGRPTVKLTEQYRQEQQEEAEKERNNALAGIGYETDADGDLEAPDAAGSDTLAEQRAQERRTRALDGLGFETDDDGDLEAPDSAGSDTLAEQQADERETRAQEGLGIEEGPEGNLQGPNSAGEETLVAKQAEQRLERKYDGLDIDVALTGDGELTVQNVEQKEQFGDVQVEVPFTGGETVEDYLEAGAEGYSSAVKDASSALFDEGGPDSKGGIASDSIIADTLRAAGQDEAAFAFEEGLRSFGKGTFEGAANIANVPSVALGLKEGGEFLGYAGYETLTGDGGEVADQTGDALVSAGAGALDTAQSNPAKFSGQLVGSLAGSYGAIAGASKASSTAGRAAAYAIQPGEEIVGGLATRAASKTATGSRVLSKVPGGRIDSEELAILAGKKAGQKLRDAVDDPRVREFLRDERGQGQLVPDRGLEVRDVESVSIDEDFNTRGAVDPAEQELSQAQYELEKFAKQERSVQQEQFEDFGVKPGNTSSKQGPTFDPDEVSKPKPRSEEDVDPYRGQSKTDRGDAGMDWGDVEPTQLETEAEATTTEVATEVEGSGVGRLEGWLENEGSTLRDLQEEIQRDFESTFGETDQQTGAESATEFFTELEQEMDTETALDQEVETSLETEVDSAVEFETETESSQESGQEFEQEVEQETETEYEQEREQESFFEDDPNADGFFPDDDDGGLFSKEYENPVAALEEVDAVAEEVDNQVEEVFE